MTTLARINRLSARVIPAADFDEALIDRLYRLYQVYYHPTDQKVFAADFHAKTWAIVLSDGQGQDVGFSTIAERVDVIDGTPVRSLFSGDTIIDRAYWGEQTLPHRWIELAGEVKAADPNTPLYWLLISKGHRTYRYMPGFTYAWYPQPRMATPAREAAIMARLGHVRFGDAYAEGIVKAGDLPTRLRPAYDGTEAASANPHARFFAEANPGYAAGNELLCLCELSEENLRPRARAQFRKGLARAG